MCFFDKIGKKGIQGKTMFDEVEQNTGINVNDFENLGLYDVDSPVTKAAGGRVKSVFEKLFQGTDIKSDDFYFLCFRSNDPNAFFVDKNKTGKKHIIAVSDALIKGLGCDEELAAVIAHEAGHYLWAKYVSGKNTIFQERWSDVNSVDSVSDMLKDNKTKLNDELKTTDDANEIELDNSQKSKKIIIKKQNQIN